MSFLRKMGDSLANVRDLHKGEFLTNVLDAFKDDLNIQKDSPFMAIYKVVDPEKNICHLVDTIGIPIGGHLAPEICTLDKGGQSHRCGYFAREMEQAMLSGRYVLKELDPGIMEGVEYRGFNEPSRYAVIIPIQVSQQKRKTCRPMSYRESIHSNLISHIGYNEPYAGFHDPWDKSAQTIRRRL